MFCLALCLCRCPPCALGFDYGRFVYSLVRVPNLGFLKLDQAIGVGSRNMVN